MRLGATKECLRDAVFESERATYILDTLARRVGVSGTILFACRGILCLARQALPRREHNSSVWKVPECSPRFAAVDLLARMISHTSNTPILDEIANH